MGFVYRDYRVVIDFEIRILKTGRKGVFEIFGCDVCISLFIGGLVLVGN